MVLNDTTPATTPTTTATNVHIYIYIHVYIYKYTYVCIYIHTGKYILPATLNTEPPPEVSHADR